GLGAAGPALVFVAPPLPQRVGQLMGAIEGYTAAPTASQLEQSKVLQGLLGSSGAAARKLVQEDLAALNKLMNEAGVPHVTVPGGRSGEAMPPGEDDPPGPLTTSR